MINFLKRLRQFLAGELYGTDTDQDILNEAVRAQTQPIDASSLLRSIHNKKQQESAYKEKLRSAHIAIEAAKAAYRNKKPGGRVMYEGEFLKILEGAGYE